MNDCVYFAEKCAEILSATLNVPCYLYGYASKQNYRKLVPEIRQGLNCSIILNLTIYFIDN